MSLKCEPSSEPLHISVKLCLNSNRHGRRCSTGSGRRAPRPPCVSSLVDAGFADRPLLETPLKSELVASVLSCASTYTLALYAQRKLEAETPAPLCRRCSTASGRRAPRPPRSSRAKDPVHPTPPSRNPKSGTRNLNPVCVCVCVRVHVCVCVRERERGRRAPRPSPSSRVRDPVNPRPSSFASLEPV